MNAIYKRELKSYLHSLTGGLYCAIYLIWAGIFFLLINLQSYYPQMENGLYYDLLIQLLLIPVLTMRTFADERRQKTDQLLYSLPISTGKIVLGKYFAVLTVIAVPMVITGVYPLILSLFGTVNLVASYLSLLAAFLFASLLAAIGMFLSTLTESPAIAAILTLIVNAAIFFLTSIVGSSLSSTALTSLVAVLILILLVAVLVYVMTRSFVAAYVFGALFCGGTVLLYFFKQDLFAGAINSWVTALSPIDRMTPFMSGIFDLTSIVYYISACVLFLFFGMQSVEKRRWS